MNLAQTIKTITRNHLKKNNGLLIGQSVRAVGWINDTVPDCKNIIELPCTDVAGSYFAVGAALTGRRPILVIRFNDFLWLNASGILNYAAKTKELCGRGTPVFIRALIQEGGGTGALHSGCFHSLFMHMPGMLVSAPVTSKEYENVWEYFMQNDMPMLCSEHRKCYKNTEELENKIEKDSDITLFGIGYSRLFLKDAAKILYKYGGIKASIIHLPWLKPLLIPYEAIPYFQKGLVIDSGYPICGAAEHVAYELMYHTRARVRVLSRLDKTICVNPGQENLTPNAEKIAEIAAEEIKND